MKTRKLHVLYNKITVKKLNENVLKNERTNIVQDEPVNCSSHSDSLENIGEVANSKQDKHHEHLVKETGSIPFQNGQ